MALALDWIDNSGHFFPGEKALDNVVIIKQFFLLRQTMNAENKKSGVDSNAFCIVLNASSVLQIHTFIHRVLCTYY